MKNIETNTMVEIEGAIVTNKLIGIIKFYQSDKNDHLGIIRNQLADTVCFMAKLFYYFNEEQKHDAIGHMEFLSSLRTELKNFEKP